MMQPSIVSKILVVMLTLGLLPPSALHCHAQERVENSLTPAGKPMTLVFTEELRFGADEDSEAYLWPLATTDLAVDSAGNMFVANTKDNRIHMFDTAGKFIKDIAIPGEGPGELKALISFQILADGRGVILEGNPGVPPSFTFLDKSMKYEKKMTHKWGFIPVFAQFSPEGRFFGARVLSPDSQNNTMGTRFGILRLEPEEFVVELSSFKQDAEWAKFGDPNVLSAFIGDMLKGQFTQSGHYAFDEKGNVYTALSSKYEITRWTPDVTRKTRVITRKYKPFPLTEAEVLSAADAMAADFQGTPMEAMITEGFLKKVAKHADLPPVKTPIVGLICIPDGKLMVVHNSNFSTGEQQADIFDEKGVYIGKVTMPNRAFVSPKNQPRMIFKNGKAYSLETDAEEDNRMVRYSYKVVQAK